MNFQQSRSSDDEMSLKSLWPWWPVKRDAIVVVALLRSKCVLLYFRIRKVHLWVFFHELLEKVLLLHFVAGGFVHGLLALVKHHFLHCLSGVFIEITQL